MNGIEIAREATTGFNNLGWRYYFDAETAAVGKGHGLGVLKFYFLGRGGALGDVEWPAVCSAFGYFKPSMVETIWNDSRQVIPARAAAHFHLECCAAFGRAHLSDIAGLEAFCVAAQQVVGAAELAGLSLFAGFVAQALPDDPPAQAMRLIAALREMRGSAHLAAVVAAGVAPRVAHAIKRPNDLAMFGWSAEDIPAITDAQRQTMVDVEAQTDRLIAPAYEVLDDAGASALLDALRAANALFADDPH